MNIKVIFGSLLTGLGIIGLLYAGFVFTQHGVKEGRVLFTTLIIGFIFFSAGIGLVKSSSGSDNV
ncbi:MAG: hypothetical protein K0R51_152 [Cytophagaceae bacterium]|jgi:hypothetical protein|nr:hypothetical protein [Cytophagaceae bacterium]